MKFFRGLRLESVRSQLDDLDAVLDEAITSDIDASAIISAHAALIEQDRQLSEKLGVPDYYEAQGLMIAGNEPSQDRA